MQKAVGGYIEAYYPFEEEVCIICNEEGLIDGLPFNRSVPGGYGGVFGTFFICGLPLLAFALVSARFSWAIR